MEWVGQLQGQVVGLDTAPLIYFIEQNVKYLKAVRRFFQGLNQGEFQVVTSTVTLTEVLVHPLRAGNIELAQQYRDILLSQENLSTYSVSAAIAELAAQLRATKKGSSSKRDSLRDESYSSQRKTPCRSTRSSIVP